VPTTGRTSTLQLGTSQSYAAGTSTCLFVPCESKHMVMITSHTTYVNGMELSFFWFNVIATCTMSRVILCATRSELMELLDDYCEYHYTGVCRCEGPTLDERGRP